MTNYVNNFESVKFFEGWKDTHTHTNTHTHRNSVFIWLQCSNTP